LTSATAAFYHPLTDNREARIELTEISAKQSHALSKNQKLALPVSSTFGVLKSSKEHKTFALLITILVSLLGAASCKSILDRQRDVRPLVMRDVPAQRLAYRFEADVNIPPEIETEDADDKIEAVQLDFSTRRQDDALVRTVRSPDGQRALVLYSISAEPTQTFHIDLYSADGKFLRNITPPTLSCVFPESVSWSPDGNSITFVAHKNVPPTPSPTPVDATPPETVEPSPLPSVAPAFPSVALFDTEQIYICNRDGYDLKPLTSREGLIYFYSSWAPDSHAIVALACRESEWDAREKEYKLPTGRPRLIGLDGAERLLDDRLTEALPVWSPDSSKVATAFETDVMIYDAATNKPTQARIKLSDRLIEASRNYEARNSSGKKNEENSAANKSIDSAIPASFNPIVRLEWIAPERLYFQTAYIRVIPNEPISTFQRWHQLALSPQAALLR
jgi:WD40 repeat protein